MLWLNLKNGNCAKTRRKIRIKITVYKKFRPIQEVAAIDPWR